MKISLNTPFILAIIQNTKTIFRKKKQAIAPKPAKVFKNDSTVCKYK